VKCSIGDWVVNKPEELRMVDGEITYVMIIIEGKWL
jgi:hypothetical protein